MKKIWILVMVLFLFSGVELFAGDTGILYNALTGDKGLDLSLEKLNSTAKGNLDGFISDLNKSYGVAKEKIESLIRTDKMEPADVYMAAKVSQATDEPIDDVVKKFKANKGKGWGVVAKELGIKPGSEEFHTLKKDDSGMLEKKGKNKDDEDDTDKDRKSKGGKSKSKKKGKRK